MNKIITSLFVLFAAQVQAQPVITSAVHNVLGATVTYTDVDASGLSEGNGGANQTWNFASLTPTGDVFVSEYIAASGTPYASSFPAANIAARTPDGMGDYIYVYHNHNSSITEYVGTAYSSNGNTIIFDFTNPQTVMSYPINYLGSNSDVFTGFYSVTSMGMTYNNYRSGTINYVADGYGTITLPTGTHANTMRIKIVQDITDSSVYVGIPLPPVVINTRLTTYNYIVVDANHRLNDFALTYDTTTSSLSGTTYNKMANYQSGLSTGVKENVSVREATFYPNPANNHILLTLQETENGQAVMEIVDIKGSLVKSMSADLSKANRFEWMFPVDDLQTGLYLSKVTCGDKIWTFRFVKE